VSSSRNALDRSRWSALLPCRWLHLGSSTWLRAERRVERVLAAGARSLRAPAARTLSGAAGAAACVAASLAAVATHPQSVPLLRVRSRLRGRALSRAPPATRCLAARRSRSSPCGSRAARRIRRTVDGVPVHAGARSSRVAHVPPDEQFRDPYDAAILRPSSSCGPRRSSRGCGSAACARSRATFRTRGAAPPSRLLVSGAAAGYFLLPAAITRGPVSHPLRLPPLRVLLAARRVGARVPPGAFPRALRALAVGAVLLDGAYLTWRCRTFDAEVSGMRALRAVTSRRLVRRAMYVAFARTVVRGVQPLPPLLAVARRLARDSPTRLSPRASIPRLGDVGVSLVYPGSRTALITRRPALRAVRASTRWFLIRATSRCADMWGDDAPSSARSRRAARSSCWRIQRGLPIVSSRPATTSARACRIRPRALRESVSSLAAEVPGGDAERFWLRSLALGELLLDAGSALRSQEEASRPLRRRTARSEERLGHGEPPEAGRVERAVRPTPRRSSGGVLGEADFRRSSTRRGP